MFQFRDSRSESVNYYIGITNKWYVTSMHSLTAHRAKNRPPNLYLAIHKLID